MSKNLGQIFISDENLFLLLTGKIRITELPENCALHRVGHDFERQGVVVMIEHPDFPPCQPGVTPYHHAIYLETVEED